MLKKLHNLRIPDPYYSGEAGVVGSSLEQLHQDMSELELPECVPESVRRFHDGVRNAYVYSYFSYDLLTLAARRAIIVEILITVVLLVMVLGTSPDRIVFLWHYDVAARPLWSGPVFRTMPVPAFLLLSGLMTESPWPRLRRAGR